MRKRIDGLLRGALRIRSRHPSGQPFFSRREGDRTAELTLGGAAPFGDEIGSPFSIPQASFTLRTPNREITLLDRVISNSPLTISRSNVRGLYLREGPWQVNAGYSFFSTFEHLLLPTDKEAVAGLAYRHRLSSSEQSHAEPLSTSTARLRAADVERSARCSTRRGRHPT